MLTATEALNNLNSLIKEANLFIEKVIEPAIKEAMTTETSVEIPFIDYWYYGTVCQKTDGLEITNLAYNQNLSLELTNEINQILADNGYKVLRRWNAVSSERQNGNGYFLISWG